MFGWVYTKGHMIIQFTSPVSYLYILSLVIWLVRVFGDHTHKADSKGGFSSLDQ